jgi:uncharacterized membrane protein
MGARRASCWADTARRPRERELEALFKAFAGDVALGCEVLAILLLALGALETAWSLVRHLSRLGDLRFVKGLWLRFASRILLALELTVAADIVRTAIAPTWSDIGQLAAIAAIRTVLNFFLERDMESSERMGAEPASGSPA